MGVGHALQGRTRAKVSEEGKAEAATYDVFACFCKSKTDEKTKAISEEEQTLSDLQSEIKKLSAKRDQLDQDIQDLTEEIADHEHFLATAYVFIFFLYIGLYTLGWKMKLF